MANLHEIDEKIEIVPFRSQWNEIYKLEAKLIQKKLENNIVDIQHIGSTTIPDIYSKPIIDIMIGVKNIEKSELIVQSLIELGYEYLGEANIAGRFYFRKRNKNNYNIALCQHDSEIWINNILFRDYLKKYPEVAVAYSLLKKKAFDSGANTLLKYSDIKKQFINEVIAKARMVLTNK